MKSLSVMIKPASAACNLRCRYCFYANVSEQRAVKSFGIMRDETMTQLLARVQEALVPGDSITLAFQGGEPTLAGLAYFERFTQIVSGWDKRIRVQYALQTNATLLDEDWCAFLARHHFLVGVSMDFPCEIHDRARVDAQGKATGSRVLAAIRLLKKHHVDLNVLCTLTRDGARHPQKTWTELRRAGIDYVQFTPCLEDLDNASPDDPYALTPQLFASFYQQIFALWLKDVQSGQGRSVKLFDDILFQLQTGRPSACGQNGQCQPQIIVEADGSAYPCDFYCLDEYRLGNLCTDSLEDIFNRSLHSPQKHKEALPELCGTCPYVRLCGGGCKRMQRAVFIGADERYCGYRSFLDACMPELIRLCRQMSH